MTHCALFFPVHRVLEDINSVDFPSSDFRLWVSFILFLYGNTLFDVARKLCLLLCDVQPSHFCQPLEFFNPFRQAESSFFNPFCTVLTNVIGAVEFSAQDISEYCTATRECLTVYSYILLPSVNAENLFIWNRFLPFSYNFVQDTVE